MVVLSEEGEELDDELHVEDEEFVDGIIEEVKDYDGVEVAA